MRLDGQVALVTGAGGGLGSLAAEVLASAGAHVVLVGRNADKLGATAATIAAGGGRSTTILADITDSAAVNRMAAEAQAACGRIDILVNNAGITSPKKLLELTDADWNGILHTSATGTFYCTRAVAPLMIERKYGRIINTGSILSARGMASRTAYSAAKAAVANFTRASAFELGPHGITVNAIAPTVIVTDLNRELVKTQPQLYDAIVKRTPIGRLGEPEDLATPLLFLASPGAGYFTGQILFVDGGYTAG
jgi:NAD(P)-dependent dehydrogenase (short-subunit alcohol dehydrogenase family)